MRQAGRYLPEYNQTRARAGDFLSLCKNPDFATEVTLQPLARFPLDAAILFSDILTIPDAMGLGLYFSAGEGPKFERPLRDEWEIRDLAVPDPAVHLRYVTDAVSQIRRALDNQVPLIGFAGSPWTIFCYMTEGKGSKTFSMARRSLFADPAFAHDLLGRITDTTIDYLRLQVAAGADLVQVFDSWAGVMDRATYRTFAIPYLKRICESITEVPITIFAKDAWFALEDLAALPCATIGLDWSQDPAWARSIVGPDKTLQGNLDPCVLYADGAVVERETARMLTSFGPNRHIANLGHGVYPDTPVDNVRRFVDTVKEYQHRPA